MCTHREKTIWEYSEKATPYKPVGETGTAGTLILNLQTAELRENKFLLLKL